MLTPAAVLLLVRGTRLLAEVDSDALVVEPAVVDVGVATVRGELSGLLAMAAAWLPAVRSEVELDGIEDVEERSAEDWGTATLAGGTAASAGTGVGGTPAANMSSSRLNAWREPDATAAAERGDVDGGRGAPARRGETVNDELIRLARCSSASLASAVGLAWAGEPERPLPPENSDLPGSLSRGSRSILLCCESLVIIRLFFFLFFRVNAQRKL